MEQLSFRLQQARSQAFAILQSHLQDWALAEDCLQDASEQALTSWQENPPDNPTAWLITVAKNRAIDHFRRHQRLDSLDDSILAEQITDEALSNTLGDDVLRLIFCCCHPDLDVPTQLAMTLKHVLGLSTEAIANALLVSEKTMEQRLTRARKKLTQRQLAFELPEGRDWQQRLDVVLQVIYLMYNEGYSATEGDALIRHDLSREAIRLARWLHQLIRPDHKRQYAELLGLLSLMVAQQARRHARISSEGELIVLEDQDRLLWISSECQEAQILIDKAMQMGFPGPYQIQAAINVLHNQASTFEETDWHQIRLLYQALLRQQDTDVIRLNYGIALAQEFGPEQGLAFIGSLEAALRRYVPFHAAVAALNAQLGNTEKAVKAYKTAMQLTANYQNRRYFEHKSALLESIGKIDHII